MGKPRNLVNLPEKAQEAKKVKFQLLPLGDSITKNLHPSAIPNCNKIQAVNYWTGGSKVRGK